MVPTYVTFILALIAVLFVLSTFGKLLAEKYGYPPINFHIFYIIWFILAQIIVIIRSRWEVHLPMITLSRAATVTFIELFVMPLALFYIGYSTNLNIFKHTKTHMLVSIIFAILIETVVISMIISNTSYFNSYSRECIMFICVISTPYSVKYSVLLLQESTTHTKHLELLLEGEAFISTVVTLILFNLIKLWSLAAPTTTLLEVLTREIWNTVLGCLVSTIIGITFRPLAPYCDGSTLLCYSLGALYLTFYVSFVTLKCHTEIAIIVLGIVFNKIKHLADITTEKYMDSYWTINCYATEVLVFILGGTKVAWVSMNIFIHLAQALIICFSLFASRMIYWFCCYPLFNFIFGYHIPLKALLIYIIAAYKYIPTLILAFYGANLGFNLTYNVQSVLSIVVFLQSLGNSLLFPCFCKYLGITNFSLKRIHNINLLLNAIDEQKKKSIEYLQNDIITANANWEIVEYMTIIGKPKTYLPPTIKEKLDYLLMDRDIEHDKVSNPILLSDENVNEVVVTDKQCKVKIINAETSDLVRKKSSIDMLAKRFDDEMYLKNSIRRKIIEIERYSYNRLLEEEVIKNKTHYYFTKRNQTPALHIPWNVKLLKRSSLFNDFLYRLLISYQDFQRNTLRQPINSIRKRLFKVITSFSYKVFLSLVIVFDTLSQLLIVYFYYYEVNNNYSIYAQYLQMADHFFYGLFLSEFIFQVLGWGLIQHFQQRIWFIEFAVSIFLRSMEQLLLYLEDAFSSSKEQNILQASEAIIFIKVLYILRIAVIQQFVNSTFLPFSIKFLQRWKQKKIMKTYIKNYYYAITQDDILPRYRTTFGLCKAGRELKLQWLKRRTINKLNMEVLTTNSRGVEVAMKSIQVATNVLQESKYYFEELRKRGLVFKFENEIFQNNLRKIKNKLCKVNSVSHPGADFLLQEVYWLRGDYSCKSYFLKHAEIVIFRRNECIVDFEKEISGIFIIISGRCVYTYQPKTQSLMKLFVFGMLPTSDYYLNLRFQEKQKDILETGNLIGEFGITTRRPYNTRVVCETSVTTLRIPFKPIEKQFYKCTFGIIRLSKLWKTLGIRFSIKHFVNKFKVLTRGSLMLQLHRGVVPVLKKIKVIHINDDISDIFLIEGVVKDSFTRFITYAPAYIKPMGQKLIVNCESSSYNVPTRLLLVPKLGITSLNFINNNDAFSGSLKYITFEPSLYGDYMLKGDIKKFNLLRRFIKKHRKYMLMDFLLQVNDPKFGIPCCLSNEEDDELDLRSNKTKFNHITFTE